ncbi:hypothetical protein [Lysobacter auxotrophicus]|uniref:Uncharacterized protein n=1 Tax=Lysobacter auxotrophicus TaxID=2992573 RepID=A0ABN6UMU9_9GAMM|nr:hypothetical protein [Lysobacter auxotrophicus]BDU17714.1 hypothetical protein LA521A_29150 [Lysobacter auxotrophicus]
MERPWIPAFAGMTIKSGSDATRHGESKSKSKSKSKSESESESESDINMGSSFRWNDGEVVPPP